MRKLLIGFAVFAGLSVCTAAGYKMKFGNEGNGGGDGFIDHDLDQDAIEHFLTSNEFRYTTQRVLFAMLGPENGFDVVPKPIDPVPTPEPDKPKARIMKLGAIEKMRKYGEERLATLVMNAPFIIKSSSPCYEDSKTEPKDAVALVKIGSICFSSQRLSERGYNQASARVELVALLMHELAHFADATEEEARELQQLLSWWMGSLGALNSMKSVALQSVMNTQITLEGFLKNLKRLSPSEVCFEAGAVGSNIIDLINSLFNSAWGQAQLIRPEAELRKAIRISDLAFAASGYCLNKNRISYDDWFDTEAGGKKDYTKDGILIRYNEYDNLEDLLLNLTTAWELTDALIADLRKSPEPVDCKIELDETGQKYVACQYNGDDGNE